MTVILKREARSTYGVKPSCPLCFRCSCTICPGSCPRPPPPGSYTADCCPLHFVRSSCHHWGAGGHAGPCECIHGGKARKRVLWQETRSSRGAGPWRGVTSDLALNVRRVLIAAGVSIQEFLGPEVLLSGYTLKARWSIIFTPEDGNRWPRWAVCVRAKGARAQGGDLKWWWDQAKYRCGLSPRFTLGPWEKVMRSWFGTILFSRSLICIWDLGDISGPPKEDSPLRREQRYGPRESRNVTFKSQDSASREDRICTAEPAAETAPGPKHVS